MDGPKTQKTNPRPPKTLIKPKKNKLFSKLTIPKNVWIFHRFFGHFGLQEARQSRQKVAKKSIKKRIKNQCGSLLVKNRKNVPKARFIRVFKGKKCICENRTKNWICWFIRVFTCRRCPRRSQEADPYVFLCVFYAFLVNSLRSLWKYVAEH